MNDIYKGRLQLFLVILFIAGSLGVSYALKALGKTELTRNNDIRDVYVSMETVQPSDHRVQFDTTGTVQAQADVNVVPQVSGRVTYVHPQFHDGGTFHKNQTVFRIDDRDYRYDVEQRRADVAQARTALDLQQAEADAALAEWRQLNPDKPAPALVARTPQLAEAQAALDAAKANLGKAELSLKRTDVRFPFDGKVVESNVDAGQYVTAGQSYGTVFALASLEVQASLNDQQLDWLLQTDNPAITIDTTFLGETFTHEGYIKRGAALLDAQTRFATVRLGFKNMPKSLLPGLFSHILVKGETLSNVWLIPASARQKDGTVWGINNKHELYELDVTSLYSDDRHIVVPNASDTVNVVTSRLSGAVAGMQVKQKDNAETPKALQETSDKGTP